MNGPRHILALILLATFALSCSSNVRKKASVEHFPMVQVPTMLDGEQRVAYMADHFWDAFFQRGKALSSRDTALVGGIPEPEVEQAVANYITLLGALPLQESYGIVEKFTHRMIECESGDTSSSVFEDLSSIYARYVYDPNSPVRDEDLYTPFARRMSQCSFVPQARRDAYAEEVALTNLNRRGTKAADFVFVDRRGRHYSLYGIRADRTVLFFSNPGCTACKEIIEGLKSVADMDRRIEDGEIAVLNIYIDEDVSGWLDYMPIYPENWYNGYDSDHIIRTDELYNVRAIPSLYLLDSDKRVILKDASPEKIINNL